MTSRRERFELARATFNKALGRLHEVLALDETPIHRDALIQRFEFTYELGWKLMFTSHTYDEAKAIAVASFVRDRAVAAFDAQAAKMDAA